MYNHWYGGNDIICIGQGDAVTHPVYMRLEARPIPMLMTGIIVQRLEGQDAGQGIGEDDG